MVRILLVAIVLSPLIILSAQTRSSMKVSNALPQGYWPREKSQPLIDKTQTIRLAPDLSQLSEGERQAMARLLDAGQIFQSIYEDQRHRQALSSHQDLVAL